MIVAVTAMIARPIAVIALQAHAHQVVIAPLHAVVQAKISVASRSCRVTAAHVMALVRRTPLRAAKNAVMAVVHRPTRAQANALTDIAKARVVSAWTANSAANASMVIARAVARRSDTSERL